MTPADRRAFLEIIVGFAELKGKQLSAQALELYWRSVQHWTLEDFQVAAEQLLRRSEFMPTPKDFEDLRRATQFTAGEAWAWVLSGFPGRQPSVIEPTPEERQRIERAVQALGGWSALGRNTSEQNDRLERRFSEHYEDLKAVDVARGMLPAFSDSGARRIGTSRSVNELLEGLQLHETSPPGGGA